MSSGRGNFLKSFTKPQPELMQYNNKWASSYANFGIALQFISEWRSGCDCVKLFKKFPRPEDIKIIKLLEMIAFKTQIIFNMVLFSLQKSTQRNFCKVKPE